MFKMNKKLSKIFIGLSLLVSFVLPLAVRGAMNAIAWEENLEAGFIYQDSNSNEFICYPLEGTNGVSIGWAHENVNTPTHLDIPSSVSDGSVVYPVKAIATSGFHGCNFETVNIPQTVEEIKPEAFLTCTNLQLIQLPYLLTEIEKSTFMDCRSLMRVSYSDSEGNSTMNNNRITRIGDHAFASCVSLFVFSVPTSILRFEQSAFQGCKSLTSFFSLQIL